MDSALPGGEQLRRLRSRAGLSQLDLAERSGLSVRALRNLESGLVDRPHPASIRRLSAALGVAAAEVAGLLGAPSGQPDQDKHFSAPWPVRVALLGPLTIRQGDAVVELGSTMQYTLLGLLAVQPNRTVGIEEIVDVLWPDDPPRTCRRLVPAYVARLRQVLEPERDAGAPARVLRHTAGGYRLELDAGRLDLVEFERLADAAARTWATGAGEPAWQLYSEACACWRGPLLAGAAPRLRAHPAAVAVARSRIEAVLAWADVALALGRGDGLVGRLRAVCAEEQLHEGLAARLMLAMAADGDQAAALEVYRAIRDRLDDQLGVGPGLELRTAHLRILRGHSPAVVRAAGAAVRSSAAVPREERIPTQLPAEAPGFTGRRGALAALARLSPGHAAADADSADSSLIVISGMGGVGKTALAVHWAYRIRSRFPGGQLYVNLRGYAEDGPLRPIEALTGFLAVLGVGAGQMPTDEAQATALYRSRVAEKPVLVLLDNAIDPDQVRPLLPTGPGSLALITSRRRMAGLIARDGAHRLALGALDPQESVELLTRTLGAGRVAAESAPTEQLADLCAHLPLALRIAAANLLIRPRSLISEFVGRLTAADRLTALEADDDRSAAIRGAFELSCAWLTADERRVFRLLGLAPGPDIAHEAAAALTGLTVEQAERTLDRLAAHHLLDDGDPGRFALHDLLRFYACELAADEEDAGSRHAAMSRLTSYYRAGVAQAAQLLYPHQLHLPAPDAPRTPPPAPSETARTRRPGPFADGPAALAWLDRERANLVALIVHLAKHGPHAEAWGLADLFNGYFTLRLHLVDWQTAAEAAARASEASGDAAVRAASEIRLGTVYELQCDYAAAARHHSSAARLAAEAGWTGCRAVALNNLARHHWLTGDVGTTIDLLTESLALNRASGRSEGEAVVIANLAVAHVEQAAERGKDGEDGGESLAAAESLLTQALALHQRIGDRRNQGETLRCLAEVHRDLGDFPQALECAEQALNIARDSGDTRFEVTALNTQATVQVRLGYGDLAVTAHRQALDATRDIGDRRLEAQVLLDLADTHAQLGHREDAEIAVQDVLSIARQINSGLLARRVERALHRIQVAPTEPA